MKVHTLIKPVITEKSMIDANSGVFTFEVDGRSSKHEIEKAIETAFKVSVTKVTTVVRKGEAKRTGKRRLPSTTSSKKIARAWLKKGEKIDLFEFKDN